MAPALDGLEFSREKALEMRAKLWEMAEECTKQAPPAANPATAPPAPAGVAGLISLSTEETTARLHDGEMHPR